MTGDRRKPRYERATVLTPNNLPASAARHRLDGNVATHDHDFYEIALVTRGHGTHIAADGDHSLKPGSVVVIPPHQWHGYDQCEGLVVFDCFIAPELIDTSLSSLAAELPLVEAARSTTLPLLHRFQLGSYDLSLAIAQLHSISGSATAPPSRLQAVGHLLLYLDILNRNWSAEPSLHRRATGPLHPGVSLAVMLMEADLAHPWTLAELAAATASERTHLVRLFQRNLGLPPIAYLNRMREQAAARLLVQTDQPVAHISAQLGWDDASYFARRFKAAYGLRPSEYRKRALDGEFRRSFTADSGSAPRLPVSGTQCEEREQDPLPLVSSAAR